MYVRYRCRNNFRPNLCGFFNGLLFCPLRFLSNGEKQRGSEEEENHIKQSEIGLTGKEAALTSSYWLILSSFLLVGVGLTGILAHLIPMLIDRGVTPQTAALCMSGIGVGIISGRIFAGFLMDYFFAPYVFCQTAKNKGGAKRKKIISNNQKLA